MIRESPMSRPRRDRMPVAEQQPVRGDHVVRRPPAQQRAPATSEQQQDQGDGEDHHPEHALLPAGRDDRQPRRRRRRRSPGTSTTGQKTRQPVRVQVPDDLFVLRRAACPDRAPAQDAPRTGPDGAAEHSSRAPVEGKHHDQDAVPSGVESLRRSSGGRSEGPARGAVRAPHRTCRTSPASSTAPRGGARRRAGRPSRPPRRRPRASSRRAGVTATSRPDGRGPAQVVLRQTGGDRVAEDLGPAAVAPFDRAEEGQQDRRRGRPVAPGTSAQRRPGVGQLVGAWWRR